MPKRFPGNICFIGATAMMLSEESKNKISTLQKNEITEHHIYTRIAQVTGNLHNRDVLTRIAGEELQHYEIWKRYTGRDTGPEMVRVWFYYLLARLLGVTFAIKLMEGVEQGAQKGDRDLLSAIPEMTAMLENEAVHERELIALIDEERLRYVGSVVLGLNDALVEFTGTLAGLTFAIQNSQIIAVAGLITGVAASLSMAASEYLSQRSDATSGTVPVKAALYTGATYIVTVSLLILPFLVLNSPYIALLFTLAGAVAVIFLFTFYISVAKDLPFWKRFGEMAAISLGIAAISFFIGLLIRVVLNVNV
ncbi:MAG: VIT1/CCC1 transporter family protein [Methanoregula sp.]|nr:VIT1/CCC1 transporter family protein [Methanoregula sp.]